MKKSTSTKAKFPVMAMLTLAVVVAAGVFVWNSVNKKLATPMGNFLLPLLLAIAGGAALFFKPFRVAAGPLLLSAAATGGVAIGDKASKSGLLGKPSGYRRYNYGQDRPATGTDRPYTALQRPADGVNGPSSNDRSPAGQDRGSRVWDSQSSRM